MSVNPVSAFSPSTHPVTALPRALEHVQLLEQIEIEVWTGFHRLAPKEEAAQAGLDYSEVGSASVLLAAGIDVLAFNRVLGLGTQSPASQDMLDSIIGKFEDASVPRFFIQVNPGAQPAMLPEWLEAHGFVHYNNWAKLFRYVDDIPAAQTDLRIECVGSERGEIIGAMTAPIFDWPPLTAKMLARLVGRPGWHHYLAYDGDTPVASAALYVNGRCGYFGPAVTLPAYRGRGAQSALIARRIRDAADLGCTLLVSETAQDRPERSAPSFRNLQRMGFQLAYLRPNYLLTLPRKII